MPQVPPNEGYKEMSGVEYWFSIEPIVSKWSGIVFGLLFDKQGWVFSISNNDNEY